jgi:hypothetical protein
MSPGEKLVEGLSGLLTAVWLSLSVCSGAWAAEATKAATSSSDKFIFMGSGGNFTTPFSTILSTSIKPPQGFNDLLITVSADTGLLTVNSKFFPFGFSFSLADVGIDVRVLVDGVPVVVGTVPSASFVTWDDQFRLVEQFFFAGGITVDELELLGVRAFTFTQPNVSPGSHLVEVQARYRFENVDFGGGSSFTEAIVGPRTLVVEGVNLK